MDDNSPGGTTLPHVWRSTDSPQSLTLQIMIFAEVKKKLILKSILNLRTLGAGDTDHCEPPSVSSESQIQASGRAASSLNH